MLKLAFVVGGVGAVVLHFVSDAAFFGAGYVAGKNMDPFKFPENTPIKAYKLARKNRVNKGYTVISS